MMKYAHSYALLCLFIVCTAWKGPNKTDRPTGTCESETKERITFRELTSTAATRANFAGEWKLNESKSELVGQFPVCIFWEGDRMFSKTMKIAGYKDFLTVHVTSSSPEWALVTTQEKLIFDGKEREATVFGSPRGESTARWSEDGQTMTVHSVKSFYTKGKTSDIKVTEVWKLINDGKSIAVQVNAGDNVRKLVYDKQ